MSNLINIDNEILTEEILFNTDEFNGLTNFINDLGDETDKLFIRNTSTILHRFLNNFKLITGNNVYILENSFRSIRDMYYLIINKLNEYTDLNINKKGNLLINIISNFHFINGITGLFLTMIIINKTRKQIKKWILPN